jgi:hypothetical protein
MNINNENEKDKAAEQGFIKAVEDARIEFDVDSYKRRKNV